MIYSFIFIFFIRNFYSFFVLNYSLFYFYLFFLFFKIEIALFNSKCRIVGELFMDKLIKVAGDLFLNKV